MDDVTAPHPTTGQKSSVKTTMEKVRRTTERANGQAMGFLSGQVDRQTHKYGDRLANTADSLRTLAQDLRGRGQDAGASLIENAAQRVDKLSMRLKEVDGERVVERAEDYARSAPWVVVASGILIGFAAARFLKASSNSCDDGLSAFAYQKGIGNG